MTMHMPAPSHLRSLALAGALLAALDARAVPTTLTYAGVLTDSGVRVEGTHVVLFELFDDELAGTVRYSEEIPGLVVVNGELIAELGNNALDDSVLELPELWLEVTVDGTTLAPRVRLNSVPYALRAQAAQVALEAALSEETLSIGGIFPEDIVTTSQLASQLASLGLANGLSAGTGINVTNGTVSIAAGGVGAAQLAPNAVTTGAIADLAVTSSKLANGAVGSAQIADGSVGPLQLVTGAVSTAQLADGAVTAAKIANATITSAQIANATITAAQIANGTITTTQIAPNAIALAQLQANSVDGSKIVASSIFGSDISDGTIGSADIGDGSVGPDEIAANAVTTTEIANGTIGRADIGGSVAAVFFMATGCQQAGLSLATACRTDMCNVVSGSPRFFECSGTCGTATSAQVCANTAAGFIFTTSLP